MPKISKIAQPIKDRQGLIPTSELTRPNSQSKQKEVEFQNKFLELTKVNGSNSTENIFFVRLDNFFAEEHFNRNSRHKI